MKINISFLKVWIARIGLTLVFVSSTCFWNEQSLRYYVLSSLGVIGLAVFSFFLRPRYSLKILKAPFFYWVLIVYGMFEVYGICFLRTAKFNWDFVLMSGILQICVTLFLINLDNTQDVVRLFSQSCFISLIIITGYLFVQGPSSWLNASLNEGLSGNRNTVATSLGILLIPSIYLTAQLKKRWSFIVLLIPTATYMIFTGSKKGVIVAGLIILMLFWSNKNIFKYLLFPIVGLLSIYALFANETLYNVVGYRIVDMFAALGWGQSVTSAQSTVARGHDIIAGLYSMWDYPFFGGGMNYFQFANHAIHYAHNNYVELLNDVGIVGTLIYYFPFVKKIPQLFDSIQYADSDMGRRNLFIFLFIFLLSKFILDFAMVSFSAMCIFSMQFLLVAEVMRRERI